MVALEQSSQIDQILSALESVHDLWLREADRYRRQRASLELGQLTEEIVPPKELLLILNASQGVGLFSPGLAWYYQHVTSVPVWEETQRLVFTAQLPLMDKIRYARYRMVRDVFFAPVVSSMEMIPNGPAVYLQLHGKQVPQAMQRKLNLLCML